MITCTKCGITKEDSYFYNRNQKDLTEIKESDL